jgi:hypothetical protein
MSVRVEVLPTEDGGGPKVMLNANVAEPGLLEHEVDLGAGVRLTIDPARPAGWRRLAIRNWSDTALPLLQALVGKRATMDLKAVVSTSGFQHSDITGQPMEVDTTRSAPWLRIALIQALDRWLHLPLEQALIHAEFGVATMHAGLDLPDGAELRDAKIDEALGWVRRASDSVVRFLREQVHEHWRVPFALHQSLRSLVDGYASLRDLVDEPDAELSAVIDAWKAISDRPTNGSHDIAALSSGHAHAAVSKRVRGNTSLIDPRHVGARVLGMGDQPRSPEIVLSKTRANGQQAVRIQVPAFRRYVDPEVAQRLMARLVDRKSGDAQGFAPLVIGAETSTRSKLPVFECTVPVRAASLVDFRADVFDALFRSRLGVDDNEESLMRVRQAVLSLREGRILLAQAAPSVVSGPGRPLVAELAAVYSKRAA